MLKILASLWFLIRSLLVGVLPDFQTNDFLRAKLSSVSARVSMLVQYNFKNLISSNYNYVAEINLHNKTMCLMGWPEITIFSES